MIDTITIAINNPISDIKVLDRIKIETDEFGQVSYTGYCGSMWIRTNENQTTIYGSLSKHILGNNIETLNYSEIMEGIDVLGAELGIPIWEGKVMRLDLGTTIPVRDSVRSYYKHLAQYPRKNRMAFANSLYFGNKPLIIVFYDKIKEMKSKKDQIPHEFHKGNWMRIEVRCHSKFIKNWTAVNSEGNRKVSDIFSPIIYQKLVQEWHSQINMILWDHLVTTNIDRITDLKDLNHYFICKGIESIGGISKCFELVDHFKYTSKSFGSSQRSRYKSEIKKLCAEFQPNHEESYKQKEFYSLVDLAHSIILNNTPKV